MIKVVFFVSIIKAAEKNRQANADMLVQLRGKKRNSYCYLSPAPKTKNPAEIDGVFSYLQKSSFPLTPTQSSLAASMKYHMPRG